MDQKTIDANLAVVRQLCERWPLMTLEEFRAAMAPDCDYRNIPVPGDRHVGPDAAHAMLSRMREQWDVTLTIRSIAAQGNVVLTERHELFKHKKGEREDCNLPVMGAFELKDGKITAWRDYWELTHAKSLMG